MLAHGSMGSLMRASPDPRSNDCLVYTLSIETLASKGGQKARVDVQHSLWECCHNLLRHKLQQTVKPRMVLLNQGDKAGDLVKGNINVL